MRNFTPRLAFCLASGLGTGLAPLAPGTFGSIAGLLMGIGLSCIAPGLLVPGVLVVTATGLWSIPIATGLSIRGRGTAVHQDPGWVVIDEIAGQMVALFGLHRLSPLGLAMAFALFRLFDILKPWPIGWADRQTGAAWIMADDLLAGSVVALILPAVQALHPL